MKERKQGFFMAMAIMNACHDLPTVAADVIREAGFTCEDCSELDEYEKEQLRIINLESGLHLTGL